MGEGAGAAIKVQIVPLFGETIYNTMGEGARTTIEVQYLVFLAKKCLIRWGRNAYCCCDRGRVPLFGQSIVDTMGKGCVLRYCKTKPTPLPPIPFLTSDSHHPPLYLLPCYVLLQVFFFFFFRRDDVALACVGPVDLAPLNCTIILYR